MDPTLTATLDRELLAAHIGEGEPGAVIAIYRDGEIIAHTARGVADTETGEPLTEFTRMNIASVSKQLTAATVTIVAGEGTVDLDGDIRAYVPEVQLQGITLRGCLNHTAGLPDYMAAGEIMGLETIEAERLDWFIDWISALEVPDFAPGDASAYSNSGFVLAALAVERATQTAFPELIANKVFRPLGMDSSLVMELLGEIVPGMSMSFQLEDGSFVREGMGVGSAPRVRGVNGDGEILTTITDFARWHGFLSDGRVLGDDVRRELLTRAVLTDGQVSSYGLGIEHEHRGDIRAIAHSGSMWSYSSYSLYDPASGLSAVAFANRSDLDMTETAWRALRIASESGGVTGRWFSERFAFGLHLAVRADGDLEASDGDTTARLSRSGRDSWAQQDDLSLVELRDGELSVSVEFGLRQRFQRVAAAGDFPDSALGAYSEPYGGAEYRIERDDAGIVVVPPRGDAQPVTPFGERGVGADTEWIGAFADGYLMVPGGEACGNSPSPAIRYGSGTLVVTLARRGD